MQEEGEEITAMGKEGRTYSQEKHYDIIVVLVSKYPKKK